MNLQDKGNQIAVIVCAEGAGPRLMAILDAAAALSFPMIVIMERGAVSTAESFGAWESKNPNRPARKIVTSRRRMLTAGFNEARALGCTHAMIVMAGEEFDVGDLSTLLHATDKFPAAVVIGYRRERASRKSFIHFCNRLLWLETGLHLRDSECGQRVYPLRLIDTIDGKHKHYFGHTELLAWAAWAGCPVVETRLAWPAAMGPERQSHFIELRYKLREMKLHAGLILRELSGLPYPHYTGGAQRQPFWRGFWQWCNPLRAWRELRDGGASRGEMAAGVAAGVFIANLPAYGFQTFLALYSARRLHLNPVAVVTGSQASMPPLGPALNLAAVWLGHVMLHGRSLPLKELNPFQHGFLSRAVPFLFDWLAGSLVLGIATGIVAFFAANLLFRLVERPAVEGHDDGDDKRQPETVVSQSAP